MNIKEINIQNAESSLHSRGMARKPAPTSTRKQRGILRTLGREGLVRGVEGLAGGEGAPVGGKLSKVADCTRKDTGWGETRCNKRQRGESSSAEESLEPKAVSGPHKVTPELTSPGLGKSMGAQCFE